MKWIKKNWKYLAFGILVIIFFMTARACNDADYKKEIKELNKEIVELNKKNIKLAEEAGEYFEGAQANEKVVTDLKAEVAQSKLKIKELERKEVEVGRVVMALPPLKLVEETIEILGCADILLNQDGILFSVECARQGLLKLKQFSIVENKYNEALFALSKSEEALHFQERVSWNLYGVAWKLGEQILNLKVIGKKKDQKYELSEKHGKKSWFNGLFLGLAIGAGLVAIIVIIIPLIKLLI